MNPDETPIASRMAEASLHDSMRNDITTAGGLLTYARALKGMQKEALVLDEDSRARWRLLCDEGPWLNGTDLAPFPLGYFAAGIASCLLADLRAEAATRSLPADGISLRLDVHFTMEGSLLRGTMAAGVAAIVLTPQAGSGIDAAQLAEIVSATLAQRSAVGRTLAAHLPSRFRLTVNGAAVDWPGQQAGALANAADPAEALASLPRVPAPAPGGPIIQKCAGTPPGEGGAVGLRSEQKRTVHIAADARTRSDGLQEIGAQCVHPPGSRFSFLAAGAAGDGRAPGGTAYLSAGIAFCFMTQLGRYAEVKKLPLRGYRIVQRTAFCRGAPAPVEAAVFLDSDDTHENNLKMVQMGEQTCYVHTTLREPQTITIGTAGLHRHGGSSPE